MRKGSEATLLTYALRIKSEYNLLVLTIPPSMSSSRVHYLDRAIRLKELTTVCLHDTVTVDTKEKHKTY